jgi:hypothetical protein
MKHCPCNLQPISTPTEQWQKLQSYEEQDDPVEEKTTVEAAKLRYEENIPFQQRK